MHMHPQAYSYHKYIPYHNCIGIIFITYHCAILLPFINNLTLVDFQRFSSLPPFQAFILNPCFIFYYLSSLLVGNSSLILHLQLPVIQSLNIISWHNNDSHKVHPYSQSTIIDLQIVLFILYHFAMVLYNYMI